MRFDRLIDRLTAKQKTAMLALILLLAVGVATQIGAVSLPWSAWHCRQPTCQGVAHILWQIRLPRVLLATLVGAALAVSGAAMQGLFRNPLVDPAIVGVSAGAGLAAAAYLVVFAQFVPLSWSMYALPIAACSGGWLVSMLLYRLSMRQGQLHMAMMLLIGIAISAFAGAMTGVLVYLSDDTQLRSLTFWSMGSLASANWQIVGFLALVVLSISPLIWREYRALNAFTLGETEVAHIGFAVKQIKRRLVIYAAILVGTSVAFVGTVGFIGLVVPHIMRLFAGANYRFLLPNSVLFGAILLLLADTLARSIAAPAEVPVGIFTALFGAPFLAALVYKGSRSDA